MIWMGMSVEQWFILFLLISFAVTVVFTSIRIKSLKTTVGSLNTSHLNFKMSKPAMTYEQCKEILDTCISDAIIDLEMRYEINEVKYIKNMEKDTISATNDILSSISPNVLTQMECYITKSHIIRYISRNVKLSLMDYMDRKK